MPALFALIALLQGSELLNAAGPLQTMHTFKSGQPCGRRQTTVGQQFPCSYQQPPLLPRVQVR